MAVPKSGWRRISPIGSADHGRAQRRSIPGVTIRGPVFGEDPGQEEQDDDLGQFRGLAADEGDPDPAPRSRDRPAEEKQARS